MQNGSKKIRVAELFAGVGGFRIGLERARDSGHGGFEVVWSNQWEPSSTKQHASEVYVSRFGPGNHSNTDISKVPADQIPEHDLLVGGFPCQDYSVARTLSQAAGLTGKKGVLWWEIHRILKDSKRPPKYLMLENVDRLLKSPANQRGRDFAIMLSSLHALGYAVEWRVINAAEYGMPQRRRRIYLVAYKERSGLHVQAKRTDLKELAFKHGVFGHAFNAVQHEKATDIVFDIPRDVVAISEEFNPGGKPTPFENVGVMVNGRVYTTKARARHTGPVTTLGDIIIEDESLIPEEYFIPDSDLERWAYLKSGKKELRTTKAGFSFYYNEGPISFPDPLDKPSRTIITSEGGSTPSRFKHVIRTKSGRLRRLTPIELERLDMFPDNHTEGPSPTKRAFFMGNALVVGVIEKIGKSLLKKISETSASPKKPSPKKQVA